MHVNTADFSFSFQEVKQNLLFWCKAASICQCAMNCERVCNLCEGKFTTYLDLLECLKTLQKEDSLLIEFVFNRLSLNKTAIGIWDKMMLEWREMMLIEDMATDMKKNNEIWFE